MTPQAYIEQKLNELKVFKPRTVDISELPDKIFNLLMSKKFRKYSANEELKQQIKNAIKINIDKNQPINITFPHGAYKLWRLEEAPLPDWAELFAAMYYTEWLKPICEIYKPGVWFEYYVDDYILPKMNNITLYEVNAYVNEYQRVLNFLKQFQPNNFKMTIKRFGDAYSSYDVFEMELIENIEKLKRTNPIFKDEDLVMVELNAKPTIEQLKDSKWREKVRIIHDAYMSIKRKIGYYYHPTKIPAFSQPLASGKFIIVGTTKTSIAKFWVGIGALQQIGESFREYILTPKQIEAAKLEKQNINIEDLSVNNFKVIKTFTVK